MEQTQEMLMDVCLGKIKQQSYAIKQSFASGEVHQVVSLASEMLLELRTAKLSPKNYYQLFVTITDELRFIEMSLMDEYRKNSNSLLNLYEFVQYNPFGLNRLYLMITIGMVYIRNNILPVDAVLRDLVEMCRGVQNPLRGLFLRTFLLQATKNVMKDLQKHDDAIDAIEFILINFSEMNKLWVRMQHLGHSSELVRREQERKELKLLVGSNLLRLSQLDQLNVRSYEDRILPAVLQQITCCRDPIAQEYLLECVVQVFPDAFHIQTLGKLIDAIIALHHNVNINNLVNVLSNRLADYANTDEGRQRFKSDNLIQVYMNHINRLITHRSQLSSEEAISLFGCMLNLCARNPLDRLNNVRHVFNQIENYMTGVNALKLTSTSPFGKETLRLLKQVVDSYSDLLELLSIDGFTAVTKKLEMNPGQKDVALHILFTMTERGIVIEDDGQKFDLVTRATECLFEAELSSCLLSEEIELFAVLPNLVRLKDHKTQASILESLIEKYKKSTPTIGITLTSAVFSAYAMLDRTRDLEGVDNDFYDYVFRQICFQSINELIELDYAEMPLRLFTTGAVLAAKLNFSSSETISYEFITQAYTLFEDRIHESRCQSTALATIYSAVQEMRGFFNEETESILCRRLSQATSQLLRKADQSRLLTLASQLFWKSDAGKIHERVRVIVLACFSGSILTFLLSSKPV
ncbi:hypothetical protein ACOME3_008316 [Neoechinorhynchus agilis]